MLQQFLGFAVFEMLNGLWLVYLLVCHASSLQQRSGNRSANPRFYDLSSGL
jgi:hypothetical protein